MKKRIVLISCGKEKLDYRAQAKDLYTGQLFKLNLKYANNLAPDEIFILSAKYGLLSLEQEIEPYDLTLKRTNEIKTWAVHVLEQLDKVCSLDNTEFIFLAGDKYRKYLLPHLKNYKVPLEGLKIGYQLQKLKILTSN